MNSISFCLCRYSRLSSNSRGYVFHRVKLKISVDMVDFLLIKQGSKLGGAGHLWLPRIGWGLPENIEGAIMAHPFKKGCFSQGQLNVRVDLVNFLIKGDMFFTRLIRMSV